MTLPSLLGLQQSVDDDYHDEMKIHAQTEEHVHATYEHTEYYEEGKDNSMYPQEALPFEASSIKLTWVSFIRLDCSFFAFIYYLTLYMMILHHPAQGRPITSCL